jgi:hypothetical protein
MDYWPPTPRELRARTGRNVQTSGAALRGATRGGVNVIAFPLSSAGLSSRDGSPDLGSSVQLYPHCTQAPGASIRTPWLELTCPQPTLTARTRKKALNSHSQKPSQVDHHETPNQLQPCAPLG